jgi:hypothetical protein
MSESVSIPEFVRAAEETHPGIVEEYSALTGLAHRLLATRQSESFRHTVLLQCAIGWHHYHAVILLVAHRFVVQGWVLSRTLFELVVSTLYLLKNPDMLPEFVDYGKLVFYESALVAGLSEAELAPIRPECEKIKTRFGKRRRNWHGKTINELAEIVGLGGMHRVFYKSASAAAHGDGMQTLSFGSRGWRQSLRSVSNEKRAASVRYESFMVIGTLLLHVNEVLDVGLIDEAKALFLLMEQRTKSLVRPN